MSTAEAVALAMAVAGLVAGTVGLVPWRFGEAPARRRWPLIAPGLALVAAGIVLAATAAFVGRPELMPRDVAAGSPAALSEPGEPSAAVSPADVAAVSRAQSLVPPSPGAAARPSAPSRSASDPPPTADPPRAAEQLPPGVPTNVGITRVSAGRVQLTWSAGTGDATAFTVGDPQTGEQWQVGADARSYARDVDPAMPVCMRVAAVSGAGGSGWSDQACVPGDSPPPEPAGSPPVPPANIALKWVSDDSPDRHLFNLTFTPSAGATSYELMNLATGEQDSFRPGTRNPPVWNWIVPSAAEQACVVVRATNSYGSSDWTTAVCAAVPVD